MALGILFQASCNRPPRSEGEALAQKYCAACHAFPEPQLLDRKTWQAGVLPQMATRLGAGTTPLFSDPVPNRHMLVLTKAVSEQDWEKIVGYYREHAPDTLPDQSLPAQPQVDPPFFVTGPFASRLESSGIITLLKADSIHRRVFVGEAGSNKLRMFDWNRHPLSSLALDSPPTDLIVEGERVLLLESGRLEPNDEPKGSLVEYDLGADSLRFSRVVIDSLFRPVFVERFDFNADGLPDFLISEFGNNRGRLALYIASGSRYERHVLDPAPGAIRCEIRDMTGDGAPDIVALFAQGDERIVQFTNDGRGGFSGPPRILARFPPVYGSMYFTLRDINGDGRVDLVYVNGDNFDYSRILKPYHGIRILENDGENRFHERYFFPLYGAARAVVADFDKDGDLDILATSNFADRQRHPERGIVYLENAGRYVFRPYAFTVSGGSQWNVMATGDLNRDGWLDVIIGAMDLDNIATLQRTSLPSPSSSPSRSGKDLILFFENRMLATSNQRTH